MPSNNYTGLKVILGVVFAVGGFVIMTGVLNRDWVAMSLGGICTAMAVIAAALIDISNSVLGRDKDSVRKP